MQISTDEARALAFIGVLIGLTLLGRWVDRPRPLGEDQPAVDMAGLALRSEAALAAQEQEQKPPRAARGSSPGPGARTGTGSAPSAPAGGGARATGQAARGGAGGARAPVVQRGPVGTGSSQPAAGGAGGTGGQLDLNRATAAELERLPGVGPALAERIVAYREKVGRFRSVEELDSVKGIGPAMLARLKPLVRL